LVASLKVVSDTQTLQLSSDAELLFAVARQDQTAFTKLIARHYHAVYRVAWRACRNAADSEDVTQEAFLKLWHNPAQLRDGNAVKGWLMRVVSNLVIDKFRQKPMLDLDMATDVADNLLPPDQSIDRTYVTARLDKVIQSLPERQRLALSMVHFEHMTNIAAARAMEISVDALESLLARARRTLKENLATDGRQLLAACISDGP
jgi:RNA polymerase sigma-70 factor, ECF subfamily